MLTCCLAHTSTCNRAISRRPLCSATVATRFYSTTGSHLRDHRPAPGTPANLHTERSRNERQSVTEEHNQTAQVSADHHTTAQEPVSMKSAMRNLMRHVPSTVTVITVHATHPEAEDPLPVGSAISSFSTVTLDPPHVSFNIKTPSRTLDAIQDAGGKFRVHILDNSIEAAEIAHNFTQGNSLDTLKKRKDLLMFKWYHDTSKDLVAPRIVSDCVLGSLDCQLVQEARVADHVLVIARVDVFTSTDSLAPALLYQDGAFRKYNAKLLYTLFSDSDQKCSD